MIEAKRVDLIIRDSLYRSHEVPDNKPPQEAIRGFALRGSRFKGGKMITLTFAKYPGVLVVVLESGNLERIRNGKPLLIDLPPFVRLGLTYTPDLQAFETYLKTAGKPSSPEELDAILKSFSALPEVKR